NVRGGMGPDPTSQRVQEDARKTAQLEADLCLEERGRAGGSRQSRGFDGSPPAERQTGPQGGEEDFTPRGSGLVASFRLSVVSLKESLRLESSPAASYQSPSKTDD